MPSFDAVNEIDLQEADNAVNNTEKEIRSRYDFRDSKTEITFNRKDKVVTFTTEDSMKLKAVREMLVSNFVKRKLDPKSVEFQEAEGTSHGGLRQKAVLKEGIDRETAKKMIKIVKDTKLKVQASIHDDKVRVTGKKIDDLQQAMAELRSSALDVPLQFVNFK